MNDGLREKVAELEAENARLREALEPFSDLAGEMFVGDVIMAWYHDTATSSDFLRIHVKGVSGKVDVAAADLDQFVRALQSIITELTEPGNG